MKAQLRRNHEVVGIFEGWSVSRLAEWLFVFPVVLSFTALAVLWYTAQKNKGLVEIELGNYTLTLDGGET